VEPGVGVLLAGRLLHLSRLSSEKQGSFPQNSHMKRLWPPGLRAAANSNLVSLDDSRARLQVSKHAFDLL
jgi:hypothetical protein